MSLTQTAYIAAIAVHVILIILAILAGCQPERKETFSFKIAPAVEKKPAATARTASEVTASTNIHYNSTYCLECHTANPPGGDERLKYEGNYRQLCWCHYDKPGDHLHPVDMEPSPEIKAKIPEDFPLQQGMVSCNTCHNIFSQCQENEKLITQDQMFLRGAPYKSRTGICFKCHDEAKYRMYNPHNQVSDAGKVIEETCLYCHPDVPDQERTTYENVKLLANLDVLCTRCHYFGGGGTLHQQHFRSQPTPGIAARMKEMKDRYSIVMILNEEGKVTCATCHNPHEKVVTPVDQVLAQGTVTVEGFGARGSMCSYCHQM